MVKTCFAKKVRIKCPSWIKCPSCRFKFWVTGKFFSSLLARVDVFYCPGCRGRLERAE